jgi:hypothetical protein
MKRIIVFALVIMLLTGCGVSRTRVNNWNPNDYPRASTFYECLQQAQQVESRAGFGANQYGAAGSARTGAITNKEILVACMNAKGYQLRKITGVEIVISLITLPLSIPFVLIGGDFDIY